MVSVAVATLLLVIAQPVQTEGPVDARLYGRVTTTEGRVVEGWLRWDRNEGSRHDFLDAAREIPAEVLREAERLDPAYGEEMRRKRSLVAFGVRITWAEDDLAPPPTVQTAVRMSRVAEIRPLDGRRALLVLVGGDEVELVASGDLGPGMRDVVVEPSSGEVVTLEWEELARVELLLPPQGREPPSERRLHGTVTTRSGLELTGLVSWDLDEAFPGDILDGRDERGEIHVPFADIRTIEPVDDRSARVELWSGRERIMRGTNDVDRRNRGVEVVDVALGRVLVEWEELAEVRFHDADAAPDRRPAGVRTTSTLPDTATTPSAASAGLAAPTGSGRLRGTVHARDGRTLSGLLRWGHDEEHAWELLDGWMDGALVGIELAAVREIRPDGPDGALVELRDGRTLRLHGTEDVGSGHRGVFVTPDGRSRRLVRWSDVERVVLGS